MRDAIAHAVLGRRFLPVVACAARPGVGVRDVASSLVDFLPNPLARREVKGKDHGKETVRPAGRDACAPFGRRDSIALGGDPAGS